MLDRRGAVDVRDLAAMGRRGLLSATLYCGRARLSIVSGYRFQRPSRPDDMTLADAHVHLFRTGYVGRYGRASSGGDDLAVYESLRAEHAIDRALVIGYEGLPPYAGNNGHVAALARDRPWIAPLAHTPPQAPCVPSAPFLGISVFLETLEHVECLSRWPQATFDALAERAMLVSLNAVPAALAAASEAMRRLEGCAVLISHCGQPRSFAGLPSDAELVAELAPLLSLSALGHVGVKLSGLYTLAEPWHAFPHATVRPCVDR